MRLEWLVADARGLVAGRSVLRSGTDRVSLPPAKDLMRRGESRCCAPFNRDVLHTTARGMRVSAATLVESRTSHRALRDAGSTTQIVREVEPARAALAVLGPTETGSFPTSVPGRTKRK